MQPGQILVNKYGTREKLIDTTDKAAAFEKDSGELVWYSKSKLLENGWSLLKEPWVPSLGERYYYLDSYGEIETEEKENNACFQHRTLVGNIHHTKADAELYKQKLIERMGRKEN